jgi:Skp family chaperone for outer membrane proteins
MKKFLILSIGLFFISFSAKATEVATVDLDQIMKNAKVINYVETTIQKKKDEYQKEVSKKEQALADKNAELETKSAIMSKDAFEEEAKKFQQEILKFKVETKKKEDALQSAYLDAIGQINYEIRRIIKEMETEDKYNFEIVLPENQTLYAGDSSDITPEVITRLNKNMKKVNINFSEK